MAPEWLLGKRSRPRRSLTADQTTPAWVNLKRPKNDPEGSGGGLTRDGEGRVRER
jgi:hypothetical protein